MKRALFALAGVAAACTGPGQPGLAPGGPAGETASPNPAPWECPYHESRIALEVSAEDGAAYEGVVVVPIADLRAVAPGFPGKGALVFAGSPRPAASAMDAVPFQLDDLDGDGAPDELAFLASVPAGRPLAAHVYFSKTADASARFAPRVHASARYGPNLRCIAIESEVAGYRSYGGFMLDVNAKQPGRPGLSADILAWQDPHSPHPGGMDVLHIGPALGLGGFAVQVGGEWHRPPVATATYENKPPQPHEPEFRVLADGPVRAIVEETLDPWPVGERSFRARTLFVMRAGEEWAECRLRIEPRRVKAGDALPVAVGVVALRGEQVIDGVRYLAVAGTQDHPQVKDAGRIVLGLFPLDPMGIWTGVPIADTKSHGLFVPDPLRAGGCVVARYAVAGTWARGEAAEPEGWARRVDERIRRKTAVRTFRNEARPQ